MTFRSVPSRRPAWWAGRRAKSRRHWSSERCAHQALPQPFPLAATPPIFAADGPSPPTSRKSPVIMRARPGPTRIRRISSQPIRPLSVCSTPASKRAPPEWARARACSRRRTIRSSAAPIGGTQHTARKSTVKAPPTKRRSAAMSPRAPLDINAELADALGYGQDDPSKSLINDTCRRGPGSATRLPTSPSRAARSATCTGRRRSRSCSASPPAWRRWTNCRARAGRSSPQAAVPRCGRRTACRARTNPRRRPERS